MRGKRRLFSCFLSKSEPFDCVRVIHINGYIQDFAAPVIPSQITGTPPKHVLCTPSQLLSIGSRPLRPGHPLEPGRLYFLVPHSALESGSSPHDLASLVTRLTAIANRAGPADPVDLRAGPLLSGSGRGAGEVTWRPGLETIWEASFRGEGIPVGSFRSTCELLA